MTEVGGALGILGLALVFFPIVIQRASEKGIAQKNRRQWVGFTLFIQVLIATAATDATLGLLTLWGCAYLAKITGWLLILLIWEVVVAAVITQRMVV